MPDGKIVGGLLAIAATLVGSGGWLGIILRRHQKELDTKVPFELHDEMCGKLEEKVTKVEAKVDNVCEALQGKTGETGLVSDVEATAKAVEIIAKTVEAIREHQKNGG